MIMAHGKFEELSSGKVELRSFDRTFIIGPGGGAQGIRVVSDVLCLRAYGGNEAWSLESPPVPQPIAQPAAPEGYSMPAPGKSDAQVQQEQLVVQVSERTKMTPQYSEMALSGNGWNVEAALKNFEELKVSCWSASDLKSAC
jgi:nuclear RNA export factor